MSRPEFVGQHWLHPMQGFSFAAAPPPSWATGAQLGTAGWGAFLDIFERLKRGQSKVDIELLSLARTTPAEDIRILAVRLLGHCASRNVRPELAKLFLHTDLDTRLAAYEASLYSCDLRLVEALLDVLPSARPNERLSIMSAISHLLEPEPADLYDDLNEYSSTQYRHLVEATRRTVEERISHAAPVFEGRILDLRYVLARIDALCRSSDAIDFSGAIAAYFDIFEAMTGHACMDVFDEDVMVRPAAALSVVAEFVGTGRLASFQPGKRYFFGHAIDGRR